MERPLRSLALLALFMGTAAASPFRYAEDQAPALVNPLFTTSMSEARIDELVFEGLFTDDKDLRTVPLLAQSFTLAPDKLSMVIQLRTDVKWQDGQPFSSDDVVFTIQALQDKGTLSTEAGRVAWIKLAEAQGTDAVHLVFQHPETTPEEKLYFKILPHHAFQGTAITRSDAFRNKPVGTGPFQLIKYNQDASISLSRYSGYRDPAKLSDVVMREVSDKNYQAKLLLYESLEALVRVLPRDLAILQNNRKLTLYPYQTNSWWYLGFNMKRAPFDDARVRKALADLVDPASLLAPVGTGDLLTGPFVPSSPFYNHSVAPYKVNKDESTTLLGQAGWTQQNGQWQKNGQPLRLTLTAHKSLETAEEVLINLQSQLQGAGVQVDVSFLDDAEWKSQIWKDRNFDLLLGQWSFDRNEDVREQFYSTGTRNFTGYANKDVDALLDRARDATDPQDKKLALRTLHAKVHDDLPMVFLWTLDSYSAMSTKVKNVVVHPFYFFTWAREWTLP